VLDNPHNRTKIDLVNHIVNCLEMDTILFYSNVFIQISIFSILFLMQQYYNDFYELRRWTNCISYKLKSGNL